MDTYQIIPLPLPEMEALETRSALKKLASTNLYLAELKGKPPRPHRRKIHLSSTA